MPNVRKIAKNLGVSVATVSRALNDRPNVRPDTRQRVMAEASRMGYELVRRPTNTNVIGLVYTAYQGRVDYGGFDAALIGGILRGVQEQRFDVTIISMHRDKLPSEDYTSFFRRKGVMGVILRTFMTTRQVCQSIAEEGFPSIVVADKFENESVNFICTDSRKDSERAVEHLINLGHRRIGLGVHCGRDTDHEDRRMGYHDALEKHGIEHDPALSVDLVADMSGGANTINLFLSMPVPPTAIYFTDPLATLGALHRCRELGIRVPEDLSIIGFDDSDVRNHAFPTFTAVCQDASALGFEAAHWLTRSIAGYQRDGMRHVLRTTFEVNQSTAVPPEKPRRIGHPVSIGVQRAVAVPSVALPND
jgi:DNA-binding LacI/PurR family transcriptional regulator